MAFRHFSDRKVEPKIVQELLDAALEFSGAVKTQPWGFVVIQKTEFLIEISERAKSLLATPASRSKHTAHVRTLFQDPDFDIYFGGNTLIVICAKKEDPSVFNPARDCYEAGENLMMAARAKGLGTCPVGFVSDALAFSDIERKLHIPDGYTPVLPVIVGYPARSGGASRRETAKVFSWVE